MRSKLSAMSSRLASRLQSAYVSPRVLARDFPHAGSTSPRPRRGQGRRRRRRRFLNGLVTTDIEQLTPGAARFAALLTPQGKIIVDFMVTEAAAEDGGGFFFDCPRALAADLVEKLNFYKLRAKVTIEDLSDELGVMAVWGGNAARQRLRPELRRPASARAWQPRYSCRRSSRRRRRAISVRPLLVPQPTTRTASRSAFRAADRTSSTATPFRTKPTWTSSPASISKKAVMSGRRSCPASSTAPPARSRVVPIAYESSRRYRACRVIAGDKEIGTCWFGGQQTRPRDAAARPRRRRDRRGHAAHRGRRRDQAGQAGLGDASNCPAT